MKIAIAGDSAGEPLAKILVDYLSNIKGYEVFNLSTPEDGKSEYYANLSERVCCKILDQTYERAILCCGTGIGVCLSANKIPGIRAAQTHDTYSAERAALSNNAQVITMGARVIGAELAKSIADAFLSNEFDSNGASVDNVKAINTLDGKYSA